MAYNVFVTDIFNQHREKTKRQQLRSIMPAPEAILWSQLRMKQFYGYRFRRQYSIGRYVVDFYCPRAKLVIEVDGDSHFTHEAQQYDRIRTQYIKALGLEEIRLTNEEIKKNLTEVLRLIRHTLILLSPTPPGRPRRPTSPS